jgi:hypothetical protein
VSPWSIKGGYALRIRVTLHADDTGRLFSCPHDTSDRSDLERLSIPHSFASPNSRYKLSPVTICPFYLSPLTMDSMNLAFVVCLSAFIASTSFRSLASHSEFQFAKPAPAPVQKRCCQGSVRGGERVRSGQVMIFSVARALNVNPNDGRSRRGGHALRRTGSFLRALMYICMANPNVPPMRVVDVSIAKDARKARVRSVRIRCATE